MLIFSNRRDIPREYLFLELFLIVAGFIIFLCSGVSTIKLWTSESWSIVWMINWVMVLFSPGLAAWLYFTDQDRNAVLPLGALACGGAGVMIAIIVHYAHLVYS